MGEKYQKDLKTQEDWQEEYEMKKPSEETKYFWIAIRNNKKEYPSTTSLSGKWLVFVHRSQIDSVWETIKTAIKNGELGRSAKVSTAKPSPLAEDPNTHVICVYTYDSDDVEDVMQIRQKLRELGITQKIPYKTDQATRDGKYAKFGGKNIVKYFE